MGVGIAGIGIAVCTHGFRCFISSKHNDSLLFMVLYREALDRLCVRLNMYLVLGYFLRQISWVTVHKFTSNSRSLCYYYEREFYKAPRAIIPL